VKKVAFGQELVQKTLLNFFAEPRPIRVRRSWKAPRSSLMMCVRVRANILA
jgi:hypothetical protein